MSRPFVLAAAILTLAVVGAAIGLGSLESEPEGRQPIQGEVVVYSDAPSTFGRLWTSGQPSEPIVVLVHGGFWRSSFGLETTEPLAERLASEGFAVWNIEYGRSGEALGGWPHTFDHVVAAVDHTALLAAEHDLDSTRIAVVGHSAGGHLALWVAGQPTAVDPVLAVGLGAVVDIDRAAADGLGNRSVDALLGSSAEVFPDRLAAIRPRPTVPVVLINGEFDDVVPAIYSAPTGFDADVRTLGGLDHFELIAADGDAAEVLIELLRNTFAS